MIRSVPGRTPRVHPGAWVDPSAQVIGDVTIEEGASVWPLTVLRGDQDNYVTLGRNSNVQDNSVLHVTPQFPCIVGANVTIGHRCVVHACTIMDNVRIGIGAVVLTGAVVEEGAQVGAGAVVPQGKVVPAGWLAPGNRADLIVVDLRTPHLAPVLRVVSDFVHNGQAGDVESVMVDGR